MARGAWLTWERWRSPLWHQLKAKILNPNQVQMLPLTGASWAPWGEEASASTSEWVWVSLKSDTGQRKQLTSLPSTPHNLWPSNLLTSRLLIYYLLRPFCVSAFIPLPGPKWQLLKNQTERWCLQAKRRKLEGGRKVSWAETDRLTVGKKKKTLKGKTRTPLLVGLPFLLATVATNWRSGEGHFLWGQRRGLPCGMRVNVCVRALGKEKHIYKCFFFLTPRTLEAPTCAYLCTSNSTFIPLTRVGIAGPCVHSGGRRLCLVGPSCTAFQEWEFLRGFCLSSNSLLYKYRL